MNHAKGAFLTACVFALVVVAWTTAGEPEGRTAEDAVYAELTKALLGNDLELREPIEVKRLQWQDLLGTTIDSVLRPATNHIEDDWCDPAAPACERACCETAMECRNDCNGNYLCEWQCAMDDQTCMDACLGIEDDGTV